MVVRDRGEPAARPPPQRGAAAARLRPRGLPAGDATAFEGIEERLDAAAAGRALATALASLGPGERDALLLHAWTDLTYAQIAEALEIPVGTVRSRLHRARGIVGELLAAGGRSVGEPTTAGRIAPAREETR